MSDSRRRQFEKWWRFNHHRSNAHVWLCKHAKRVNFSYMLPPELHEDVHYICKRFNLSEYRRLPSKHAWQLWKITHPSISQRETHKIRTAEHLDSLSQELKGAKKAAKIDKKPTTIEVRERRSYAIPSK